MEIWRKKGTQAQIQQTSSKDFFCWGRSGFDRQLKANGEPSMNADVKRWFKTIAANDDSYYGDYALAA